MTPAEFDQYAEEYYTMLKDGVAASGELPEFFAEYKIADTFNICKCLNLGCGIIFDFGAGIGNSIPWFRKYFPQSDLICADVSGKSLEIARKRFPGHETYLMIENNQIDLPDESVNVVFSTCVFHHIPPEQHNSWLRELKRILKRSGLLIIFEHNPYNPLTRKTVRNCPFDINARLIPLKSFKNTLHDAGFNSQNFAYRIFFPGFLSALRPFERFLKNLPIGAQYYLFARKK